MKDDFDHRLPPNLFSPEILLAALQIFQRQFGAGSIRKSHRARELYQATIAMYGMQESRGEQIFLALPDRDPPDYYASGPLGSTHDGYFAIEGKSITNWDKDRVDNFSPRGIAQRIRELGSGYVFGDPTITLVVHLNFDSVKTLMHDVLHNELRNTLSSENAVWIYGETTDNSWYLQYVYPGIAPLYRFRLPTELRIEVEKELFAKALTMLDERLSLPQSESN